MYTVKERVRYSEVDQTEHLTLTGILNYFQDTSTFHSEDIGWGMDKLYERKRAWVLYSWQVVVNRYPKACEKICVSTWPTEFNKLYGIRNFTLETEGGEMLAYANSIWVYINTETGKPERPEDDLSEVYGLEAPLPMEKVSRKIRMPKEWNKQNMIPLRKSDIDTNGHVNNSKYVEIASELLDDPKSIHRIRVEYKKSAVYGDILYPKTAETEDAFYVRLTDEQGDDFAVVEFKTTGEKDGIR